MKVVVDTRKTTFWIKNVTQRWTQLRYFFPKSGYFLWFLKKHREGPVPPSCVL